MARKAQQCRHCGGPVNLTDEEKAAIRRRCYSGEQGTDLAREYKVSRQTIYRIVDDGEVADPNQATLFEEGE